jgi:hypothetical protein
MTTRHSWTESEDIAAFYLQKFGVNKLPYPLPEVAESLGLPIGTLKMRMRNFKALMGSGGLRNYAKQSERIFEHYKSYSEARLRSQAFPSL